MVLKILKIAMVALVLAFVAAQFYRPEFANPPVVESETLAAATAVPPDVQRLIERSCKDCHSNETLYPWYSRVTPFNWFLAGHIDVGRHELNFSEWDTYSREKKIHKLDEICEMVEEGAMPLPSYLWIHRDAALGKSDVDLLCGWTKLEGERLEAK
jgi:hypothetical protein